MPTPIVPAPPSDADWLELSCWWSAAATARARIAAEPCGARGWDALALAQLGMRDSTGAGRAAARVVRLAPGDAAGWNTAAVVALRRHDAAGGTRLARHALALAPGFAEALVALAGGQTLAGTPDAARSALRRALTVHATLSEAHLSLAALHAQAGALPAAREAAERALALKPALTAAHLLLARLPRGHNRADPALTGWRALRLGAAEAAAPLAERLLRSGQAAAAVGPLRAALAQNPGNAKLHVGLSAALAERDDMGSALTAARRAAHCAPNDGGVILQFARLTLATQRPDEAGPILARALRLAPASSELFRLLAFARLRGGDPDAAHAALARGLALDPADPTLHRLMAAAAGARGKSAVGAAGRALRLAQDGWVAIGELLLSLGFPVAGERLLSISAIFDPGDGKVLRALALAAQEQGRPERALALFARAAAAGEDSSSRLVCLSYAPSSDEQQVARAHRDWGRAVQPDGPPARPPARAGGRVRLGYLSPDLRFHTVGLFLAPVLEAHDRDRFAVTCYSAGTAEDGLTAALRGAAESWRAVAGLDAASLAERIRADGIDILVDLAGHTADHRLDAMALRPAPLQVSWLGYWHSTGLRAIDAVIADRWTAPEGGEALWSEEVVRLPGCRFVYRPPPYAPEPAPPPSQARGGVSFGSFNNLAKVNDAVLALWARVLDAVPGSLLVLKWKTLRDPGLRAALRRRAEAAGIAPDRLDLRTDSPHHRMLAEYADIDIALDPFPFTGGLTSCEALWMGVPLITLPGCTPVSRQSSSFLELTGNGDLVARSHDEYVAIATHLAADPHRLARRRAAQRARMAASPLCDAARFTRGYEAALLTLRERALTGLG